MEATPECAIVGAKLIFPVSSLRHIVLNERPHTLIRVGGRLDSAGIDLNSQFLPYEVGRNNHPDIPVFNVAKMWPAVTGACLMIKREVFEELKQPYFLEWSPIMPEDTHHFGEDLWFSDRVAEVGIPLYVNLSCFVGHEVTIVLGDFHLKQRLLELGMRLS